MADLPISGLPVLTTYSPADFTVVVDASDTTDGPTGTDKQVAVGSLLQLAGVPTGYYNVMAYGATGLGVASDLTAIQAAINAASAAGGGTVFFPTGTYMVDPASTTRYIALKSNVWLQGEAGSVIKIKDDCGDYWTIFAQNPAAQITNVRVRNLWFDHNVTGNTTCNVSNGGAYGYGYNQYTFFINTLSGLNQGGSDLWFEDCVFDPTPGVNTILFYASSDLHIIGNRFNFVRGRTTFSNYDDSVFYLTAVDVTVTNNRLYSAPANYAWGGFDGKAKNASIYGNVIDGFRNSINVYVGGGIINSVIANNSCVNTEAGIGIWPTTGTTSTGVVVTGNIVNLIQGTFNDHDIGFGIAVPSGGGFSGALQNISITDNLITFQYPDVRNVDRIGDLVVPMGGIEFGPTSSSENVLIANNMVRYAPAMGVLVGASATMTNVRITGNCLTDCGTNSAMAAGYQPTRSAFVFYGTLVDVHCDRNYVYDSGPSALIGLNLLYNAATSATNFTFSGNEVTTASGIALGMPAGSVAQPSQLVVQGVSANTLDLQEWQSLAGSVVASVSNAGVITAAGATIGTNFSIDAAGRPLTAGTTPSIAAGAGAGSSPTLSIHGNDLCGYIDLTPGSGTTGSSTVATITFAVARTAAPRAVMVFPQNYGAYGALAANKVYCNLSSQTVNGWILTNDGSTALTPGTHYIWGYQVLG